jgi:hypothetical protein
MSSSYVVGMIFRIDISLFNLRRTYSRLIYNDIDNWGRNGSRIFIESGASFGMIYRPPKRAGSPMRLRWLSSNTFCPVTAGRNVHLKTSLSGESEISIFGIFRAKYVRLLLKPCVNAA